MRRFGQIGLVWALALGVAAAAAGVPRVVLVGVDGASWNVIDALQREGKLPHLAALAARGVEARLTTVEPVISPVVWTSMATGQAPEVHGIGDFLADARDMRAPTVFESLAVQGLRVGTYEWLVTWPPRPLPRGFVIPDWLRRDLTMTPADPFAKAGVSDYRYSIRGVSSREGFHRVAFRELAEKAAHWNALAKAFGLDAGAVSFYALDALGHRFWADAYPAEFGSGEAPAPEAAYVSAIPDAYAAFDRALGEIVAALPPESAVLVASDHGFQARDGWRRIWTFSLEEAFASAGLAPARSPSARRCSGASWRSSKAPAPKTARPSSASFVSTPRPGRRATSAVSSIAPSSGSGAPPRTCCSRSSSRRRRTPG